MELEPELEPELELAFWLWATVLVLVGYAGYSQPGFVESALPVMALAPFLTRTRSGHGAESQLRKRRRRLDSYAIKHR
jgi:hypothetical protein